MNKSTATSVRNEALKAVEALSSALEAVSQGCSETESRHLHKQIGLAIGQIQMGILEPIVAEYPDLDDIQ
jgi:hypothetical protein